MELDYQRGLALAKRATGWTKGMSLPGNAEQQSYGLLQGSGKEISFLCRGPVGWLSDSIPALSEGEDFSVGAVPSKLLDAMQSIYGRQAVTLSHEQKNGKDRLVFAAEGFRLPCLMDSLSGFIPEASVSMPDVDDDSVEASVEIEAGLLRELLQMALQAAPSSEANLARAVVTLVFEEETAAAMATDGFLLMCARTELESPMEQRVEVHLPTEVVERVYGLLSTVKAGELTFLELMATEEGKSLMVSFEEETPSVVIPLPELTGMPVERILQGTKNRKSIATVVISPQTLSDLTVMGLEKSVVLEADGKLGQLKAWSRADVDSAEEDAMACALINASDVSGGEIVVDSKVLGKLLKSLKGDSLDLQIAEQETMNLLVVEQTSESDVTVMAAIVAQHQGA